MTVRAVPLHLGVSISMTSDKHIYRKNLMAQRKAHHLAHGATAGDKLAAQFLAQPILPTGQRTIAAYLPVGSEIDPTALMHHLQNSGHQLCLPFCAATDQAASFRAFQLGDDLAADGLGIAAPQKDHPCQPDIVLLPLLAFDRQGNRLGRGGGTYDRTLQTLRAQHQIRAIGLAYDMQMVDNCPVEPHDQPLDAILSEARYLDFAPSQAPKKAT